VPWRLLASALLAAGIKPATAIWYDALDACLPAAMPACVVRCSCFAGVLLEGGGGAAGEGLSQCDRGRGGCGAGGNWRGMWVTHGSACADEDIRDSIQSSLQLVITFLLKSDKEKDRKVAGAAFLKQIKRLSKTAGAGEDDLEAIMEAANKLVEPPYKKFTDMVSASATKRTPAKQRSSPYSGYAGAWGAAQGQASSPQVPAGYQLTPITQSRSPSPTAVTQRGISSLRPTEVFPPIHFTRPCTYCSHAGHSGCVPRTAGFVYVVLR